MKRLQLTATTLTLVILLSSTALAGNIGARTQDASLAGNIGARTDETSLSGNIGARTEENAEISISVAVKGNIGAFIGILIGTALR